MKTNRSLQLSKIIDEYKELSEIELDALELHLYERIYFYGEHFKIQKRNSFKFFIKALVVEIIELFENGSDPNLNPYFNFTRGKILSKNIVVDEIEKINI